MIVKCPESEFESFAKSRIDLLSDSLVLLATSDDNLYKVYATYSEEEWRYILYVTKETEVDGKKTEEEVLKHDSYSWQLVAHYNDCLDYVAEYEQVLADNARFEEEQYDFEEADDLIVRLFAALAGFETFELYDVIDQGMIDDLREYALDALEFIGIDCR